MKQQRGGGCDCDECVKARNLFNPRNLPTLIGDCEVDAGFVVIISADRQSAKVVAGWKS